MSKTPRSVFTLSELISSSTRLSASSRLFGATASALAILTLSSCAHLRGGTELAADPTGSLVSNDPNLTTIVILGTNDIHGALAPQKLWTRESNSIDSVEYERGGAAAFAGHLKVLRKRLGDHLIWLDAGDHSHGALESDLNEGAAMIRFFNAAGLTAAAIGSHEFDFGPIGRESRPGDDARGAFKARVAEARFSYLGANILDRATQKPADFGAHSRASMIVNAGGIQVGIIGLTTPTTSSTALPAFVKDLKFTEMAPAVVREAKSLRAQGAQTIVVTAHAGVECEPGRASAYHSVKRPDDPLGLCDPDGEISELLRALPKGTVDAVVSGQTHTVVHHWIQGVPVIQAGARLALYNLIYLTIDRRTGKVVTDRTRIEGPISVCEKVFERQRDCNGERPAPKEGRGRMVRARLHGASIDSDSQVEEALEPIFSATEVEKKRVIGKSALDVPYNRERESEMGNLVADAIRDATGADFAIMSAGGIRASLPSGSITYGDLAKAIPFDYSIALIEVSGSQLRDITRVAQSGARGVAPLSGLKAKLVSLDGKARSSDLNGDGKIDHWEIDRLIALTLPDGHRLEDQRIYKLATVDFLLSGDDAQGWAFEQVPRDRILRQGGGLLRDAVERYIRMRTERLSAVLNERHPLVDPGQPRITHEKGFPAGSKKGRSRGVRRKSKK